MRRVPTSIFLVLLLTLSAFSAGPTTQEDDSWIQAKERAGRDAEDADAKLNSVYKQLMRHLDAEEKKRLVTAERAWVTFRDAESEFEANYTNSGTDRAVNYPATAERLTEQRTIDLQQVLKDRTAGDDK